MIKLSFTTMNALINEPHTWLCRQEGLKTWSTKKMDTGKDLHRLIQQHFTGEQPHPALSHLPKFSVVEQCDFDPNCYVSFPINDTYLFEGYVDGFDDTLRALLEIKTGHAWSPGEFARTVQWKLYGKAKPGYDRVYLLNLPQDMDTWNSGTIRLMRERINSRTDAEAMEFINKAINIIENINDQNLYPEKKSYWCRYINCPYCPKEENEQTELPF